MGAVFGFLYICIILAGYLLLIAMRLGVLFAVLRVVFLDIQRLCVFFYRKCRSKKESGTHATLVHTSGRQKTISSLVTLWGKNSKICPSCPLARRPQT